MFRNVYNKIMKTINEKAGILEFDNEKFHKRMNEISDVLCESSKREVLLDIIPEGRFAFHSFNDLGLTWLKQLDIYIDNGAEHDDAGALTFDDFFKLQGDVIDKGTIYLVNKDIKNVPDYKRKERILMTLFHEIKHLYDHSKFRDIYYDDEYYFFDHQTYDINKYQLDTDVNSLKADDVRVIITECMNYGNFTESHAYMENINFEIYNNVVENVKYNCSKSDEEIFIHSSLTLYDIIILNHLLEGLLTRDASFLNYCFMKDRDAYSKVVRRYRVIDGQRYGQYFHDLQSILRFYNKKFDKIISHARVLFQYWLEKSSTNRFRKLNEKAK